MGKKNLGCFGKSLCKCRISRQISVAVFDSKNLCHPFYDFIEHILAVINIEIYDSSGNSPLCEWSSILSSEKLHWALQVFFYILTVVGIQVMMYVIYDNFDSL